MLRRKILLFLVSLVGLLLTVAIVAICLLQAVLGHMDRSSAQHAALADLTNAMASTTTQAEIELRQIQRGHQHHLDRLIEQIDNLSTQTAEFGQDFPGISLESRDRYQRISSAFKSFKEQVGMLATVEDEGLAKIHLDAAISASVSLRQEVLAVGKLLREHSAEEERATVNWFREIVLGLTIVFLVMINVFVMMFLRMSSMVLKPVDELLEGSRRLAREEFAYRVPVRQGDEFGELASAFNQSAERLQANESRKLETLAQTAVMLNHELNNAAAIIKLQLQLLGKQNTGNAAFERCLRQIHESLARMNAKVEALKHVRRIVLTDYSPDTKMLDLERSVAEEVAGKA